MADLVELDSLEILAIIDNELDPISPCPNPLIEQTGGIRDLTMRAIRESPEEGGPVPELRMSNICCSAHGLSLMITGIKDGQKRTILFDTGPEEDIWERNAKRLRADAGQIELITLSHWHRDHSGGMLKVLDMIRGSSAERWRSVPGMPVISLEADPTFEEVEAHGGTVTKNDQSHTVLDNTFLISGEIPRVSGYEAGFRFGMRFDKTKGEWEQDEKMLDERILMCRLKNKGIVMFTGCGHAGVVNSAKHAMDLGSGASLYAVIGGFHLADAQPDIIEQTASDLKESGVKILFSRSSEE
ncbi:7,8-dihydropterin-6-methyl-4-(beta-D-ribofuranosyl)-aminobenzene-5'-phosphate synthase [Colletotrichum tropicale]|nr:7,8-dihydropterin-6-methyl-4-(beta-D-ribofuranosyl)-aminobenzene-5'-phosphate synthase [Colletotrichum tropicale]